MRFNRLFPAAIAALVVFIALACDLDPWVTGKKYPNMVTITKTTRYAKAADGVSPMKSQLGAVVFSHKTHEDLGMNCVDCHHKNGNADRIKQCAVCHNGDNGYETMHGLCVDCHIAKKDGPQQCFECH